MACNNTVNSAQHQLFEVEFIDCYLLIIVVTFYECPKFFILGPFENPLSDQLLLGGSNRSFIVGVPGWHDLVHIARRVDGAGVRTDRTVVRDRAPCRTLVSMLDGARRIPGARPLTDSTVLRGPARIDIELTDSVSH